MENFWAKLTLDTSVVEETLPLHLLNEQAKYLTDLTGGIVEGSVFLESKPYDENEAIKDLPNAVYHFQLNVPFLGFSYRFFSVSHNIVDIFPVKIEYKNAEMLCQNEAELLRKIKEVIQNKETQHIVNVLYAQAKMLGAKPIEKFPF